MPSLNTLNQNKTDYLKILGLSQPPFSSGHGQSPYYEEPGSKHCLDLLLHSGRNGEHVLFVSGVLGSGKSALLQQYIARAGDNAFTCVISVDTSFDEHKLEKHLTEGFGIDAGFDSKVVLFNILRERIESIRKEDKTVVLLVDNVQKLPKELYGYLHALAEIEDADGNRLLHIIMFGEPQLEEVIGGIFKEKIKILSLSQFSYEDTKKYLQFRLVNAGVSEQHFDDMFNSVSMHNIHQLANGLPARINKLAYNRLVDVAEEIVSTEVIKETSYFSSKQWFIAVFVAAVIIAVWIYQDDVRQLFKNVENENAAIVTKPKSDAMPAAMDNASKADVFKQVEQKAQGDAQTINKEEAGLSVEDRILSGADFVEESLVEEEQAASVADSDDVKQVISGQDWLLKQDPDNFTIQVYGSGNNQDISKQFDRHQLGSRYESVAWFQTVRKNKAWFSLVVGRYPDRSSAREAVIQLPVSMTKGAWVRSYQSIHADIKKVLPGRPLASSQVSSGRLNNQQRAATRLGGIKREDWLLGQDGRQYTLQLLGTNKETNIDRLIQQYQLADEAAFYRTQKKGGQWFGLTYGVYPDRSTARAAVRNLPEKLQKEVWIRKLGSIHTDIQKTAN